MESGRDNRNARAGRSSSSPPVVRRSSGRLGRVVQSVANAPRTATIVVGRRSGYAARVRRRRVASSFFTPHPAVPRAPSLAGERSPRAAVKSIVVLVAETGAKPLSLPRFIPALHRLSSLQRRLVSIAAAGFVGFYVATSVDTTAPKDETRISQHRVFPA